MDVPFREIAEALHDLARWERHRIALTLHLANCGHAQPVDAMELGGWRTRLSRLEAGAALLTGLIPHEAAVRALEPALAVERKVEVPVPTLWTSEQTDPMGR